VRRYLVIANQTLGGEELLAAIRERRDAGEARFYVLVPATPVSQLDPEYVARAGARATEAAKADEDPERVLARQLLEDEVDDARVGRATEDPGRIQARKRLRLELERLRELDVDASGEVGVADPVEAVSTVLHRYEFDEIILSTLPERRSRWLAMGLPGRIRRRSKLPVTQVICRAPVVEPT
jgi:hypothetical protein